MAMNWLNMDLGSDSEDEDFDPTLEKDEDAPKPKKRKIVRGRGTAGLERVTGDYEEEDEEDEEDPLDNRPKNHIERERREKVHSLWHQMKPSGDGAGPSGRPEGEGSEQVGHKRARAMVHSFSDVNALCRPVKPASTGVDKTSFLKHMGLFSAKGQTGAPSAAPSSLNDLINKVKAGKANPAPAPAAPPAAPTDQERAEKARAEAQVAEERRAAAAQALALAKSAMSSRGAQAVGKIQITETRRFAGKDIQVTRLVDEESKEAKKAEQEKSLKKSGLDELLSEYDQKKKVSVLDKTRMDWDSFKKTKKEVEEELEDYKKSDKRYLEKVDFLKRAELREYEKERDARLAADVRTRGRL